MSGLTVRADMFGQYRIEGDDPPLFGGLGAEPVYDERMSPDFWRAVLLGQALGDLLVALGAITNCPHTGVELMATAGAYVEHTDLRAALAAEGDEG
jgi:hypothetical protein